MTEWHERWLLCHHDRESWQIGHVHGRYRFDCFYAQKHLVLELPRRPLFTDMIEKTLYCDTAGLRVHWILNEEAFRPVRLCGDMLEASSRPRLEILSVLSYCAVELPCAAFYVDLTRLLR